MGDIGKEFPGTIEVVPDAAPVQEPAPVEQPVEPVVVPA